MPRPATIHPPALGGIAIQLGEVRFKFGGMHVVCFAGVRIGIDRVALLPSPATTPRAPSLRCRSRENLRKRTDPDAICHALAGVHAYIAGGWLEIAPEYFHEGGLAAAVGADQAVTIAVAEFDRNIFEQGSCPKLHGDVSGSNQRSVRKRRKP